MATHALDGVAAKLDRAQEHLRALHDELPRFVDEKPHRFVGYIDPQASRYSIRVGIEKDPPLLWSIIVGDFVHNIRSALDHLLCQLVILSGVTPDNGHQFPIFTSEPTGGKPLATWNRMTKGLRSDILDAVKKVQPYTSGDRAKENALALLNGLSNEDKHRLPLATVTAIEQHDHGTLSVHAVRDVRIAGYYITVGKPLVHDAEIMWAPVEITGPQPHLEIQGNLSHPGFDGGFDARVRLAEGGACRHGKSEEVFRGAVGPRYAAGVRVWPPDRACRA